MYPGLKLENQYYKWKFIEHDDENSVYVTDCPGCGRELRFLHHSHKCPGTKLAEPIDNKLMPTQGRFKVKEDMDRELKSYLIKQDHTVIVSD